jgi:hypothetical protein
VLTLIGMSSLNTTILDNLMAGKKRASEQAFYTAEAGIHELMGRFRKSATHAILDNGPSNPYWKLLLAKHPGEGSRRIGFNESDPNSIISLQSRLDFGVEIKHKIDAANQVVQYGGTPIYLVKSYGFTADGGNKVIEAELKIGSSYDPPAALYSESPVRIEGNSSYINGNDSCDIKSKPGVMTTKTITESGHPTIMGSPPKVTPSSDPLPFNLPLREMIDYLKGNAHFRYSYNGNATLVGYSDRWGTPTMNHFKEPMTYTGPMNIIYFNMQGDHTLKLTNGSHGAGILMVDGNLEIQGGFIWYGVIIVTGGLSYTGDEDQNVTGGVLAGEAAFSEVYIGGKTNILYCSTVGDRIKDLVPAIKITRWKDIF